MSINANFNVPRMPSQLPDHPRRRIDLECIGSFRAHTQDGETRVIEIWTQFRSVFDRNRRRVTPGLLVLTTTDGYSVDRVAKGEYRLHDSPEVSLSSNDRLAA